MRRNQRYMTRQGDSPERWIFDKETSRFVRQTESWERTGMVQKEAKVFNYSQISMHRATKEEQKQLEMVRD